MYDNRRGGGVLGAFVLGGMLGAVLGLLFSPRSGKENREMIAEVADKYWGEGKDIYQTSVAKVTDVYSQGREVAGEKTEELREKIDAARDRLKEQVGTASEVAREKVSETIPAVKDVTAKAADVVKTGVETAEKKAQGTLDMVADKVGKRGSDATDMEPEV